MMCEDIKLFYLGLTPYHLKFTDGYPVGFGWESLKNWGRIVTFRYFILGSRVYKNMKKNLAYIIFIFLCGCATKAIDNRKLIGRGFPVHGKFCGPNIPFVEASNPVEHSKILKSIQPIDNMDMVCKYHDICYVSNSHNIEMCDSQLIEAMDKIKEPYDPGCKLIRHSIISYFKMTNPGHKLKSNNVWYPIRYLLTPIEFFINSIYFLYSSSYSAIILSKDLEDETYKKLNFKKINRGSDVRKNRFDRCIRVKWGSSLAIRYAFVNSYLLSGSRLSSAH